MDLGCTPLQSFFKISLPEIMPGVISYFVTGLDFITLPVEIYNYTKKQIHPKIYAMFTMLFLLIFILMVVMNLLQMRQDNRKRKEHSL